MFPLKKLGKLIRFNPFVHLLIFCLIFFILLYNAFPQTIQIGRALKESKIANLFSQKTPPVALPPDKIDFEKVLEESDSPENSLSKNWWLNSGGLLFNDNGSLKTIQGSLEPANRWFKAYLNSTPIETDGGAHPQNIFRLVNKNNLQNIVQQADFKINRMVKSNSPNRNESNGLLFFNRLNDGDNLYYTGIRVDGTAIIKKKKNGHYYTLSQQKVYEGTYHKELTPNLLPEGKWFGLRTDVKNLNFKEVELKVFIDKELTGNWEQIAQAKDDGLSFDGSSFINAGHPGIRTDFMDIEFKNYTIEQL